MTYADATLVRGTALKGATVEVFKASRAAGANGLPIDFLGDTVVGADGTWSLNVGGLVRGRPHHDAPDPRGQHHVRAVR